MTKKTKKNKKHAVFRYIRKNLTIILMILMSLITVGTFAWFSVSNSPRVQNLALVADHEGNLMIADDVNGTPGTYSDVLDLTQATGYDYMQSVRLSPVTTANGKEFYSPNYDAATNTVGSVSLINDHSTLINSYIYEKTFYLKARKHPRLDIRNGCGVDMCQNPATPEKRQALHGGHIRFLSTGFLLYLRFVRFPVVYIQLVLKRHSHNISIPALSTACCDVATNYNLNHLSISGGMCQPLTTPTIFRSENNCTEIRNYHRL